MSRCLPWILLYIARVSGVWIRNVNQIDNPPPRQKKSPPKKQNKKTLSAIIQYDISKW